MSLALALVEAKTVLQENEEIKFVILAIDHALSDDECLGYVAEYRRAMAWSRLPALILLPDGRDEPQVKLVADSATSRFMFESTDSANIIEVINKALAENLDFSWGVAAVGAQQTVE